MKNIIYLLKYKNLLLILNKQNNMNNDQEDQYQELQQEINQTSLSPGQVRRSAEQIEDADDVVHGEDSPKDQQDITQNDIVASRDEHSEDAEGGCTLQDHRSVTSSRSQNLGDNLSQLSQTGDSQVELQVQDQQKLADQQNSQPVPSDCQINGQSPQLIIKRTNISNQEQIPQLIFGDADQLQPQGELDTQWIGDISFKDKAIPLISWNVAEGKFQINQEAIMIISQIEGPIGVIAVAGMYRTGKSYLLNRILLNAENGQGFGVGPSINPCTKGLWIWAKPVVGYSEKGEKLNILIVDSEGLGGLDEENNHDMRIFSLALLISSFFIYNSMGSIDETALQNLSFVSNLSKHIKVKTQTSGDGSVDGSGNDNELVQYMPKFMWVVRDFSLQLVDDQNKEINSMEYLERALADSPAGSTQESVQKNQTKQHLRKYFPHRDCFTMVRPVVNENNLQNINALPIEELRSEFVEQAFILRKKVMNGMRTKQIKSQNIDGKMWIQIVQQYIQAINSGTVPSIESSWTYICKQKAQKAFEKSRVLFEQLFQKDIVLPLGEKDLEQCIEYHSLRIKGEIKKEFRLDTETQQQFVKEFDQFLAQQQADLKSINLEDCRQLSANTLSQLFQELNQRFVSDVSPQSLAQNINSLQYTLQEIQNIYDAKVCEYNEKYFDLVDAKATFLNGLVYFIHRNLDNENQSLNKILNEFQDRNHSKLLEAKEAQRIEKQTIEVKFKETMLSKAEAEASLELVREQYEALKRQKDIEDKQVHAQLRELKDQYQNKLQEQRKDKDEFDETIQLTNRKTIQAQSEFEKERALAEQKIIYLEKSLEEKTLREKQYMANWSSQKSELSQEIRQVSLKYESEIKTVNMKLGEERERSSELEAQLQDLEQGAKQKNIIWHDQEFHLKALIEKSQENAKQVELATAALKNQNIFTLENQLKEKSEQFQEILSKMKELESKAQETEEDLKQKLHRKHKEMAIKDQKVEFLEIQLKETREQLEEANKQHQSMVEAMNSHQENVVLQGDFQSEKPGSESPSRSDRLQIRVEDLLAQINLLQDKSQELEIQLKLRQTESDRSLKELQLKVGDLEQQKQNLLGKVKEYEVQQNNLVIQLESKYLEDIKKLEEELEEKQASGENDLKALQQRSEESLAQLKNFYEAEKEKLELRLREERERAQKKIDQYQEEFERKMRNDFGEKDEEIEVLRETLTELEQRHSLQMTQSQHELNLRQQIIDSLEKQTQDQKQRIELIESTRNQVFEKQLEFFEQQRSEYNARIDRIQAENLDKDRQLAQVQHKLERLAEDSERKQRDLTQTQDHLLRERDLLADKLEQTKKRLSDVQDEAQSKQLIFGRDNALNQQSIEFLQRKIQELQTQYEEKTLMYENKLQSVRNDLAEENQQSMERLQNEKDMWEQKFEQKRKALKEIEQQLNRENAELEKKLCLLQESYTRLDQEKRRMESDYQDKVQEYEAQIQNLDSTAGEAYYYGNAQAESIMQLKATMQELERQLSDLQSTYDKDKALWEGKCQFLENQKENYKKDLIESQRKFEITLEQLQKRGTNAQDKYQFNQNALVKVIENKYKAQIKEMLESHQQLQNEVQNKNKRLEEENRRLHQACLVGQKEMEIEKQQLEQKARELQKVEQSLQNDLNEIRADRDRKVNELQKQLQKDKEMYKMKMSEAEKKQKELEGRRTQMIFDMEKEKARWQMEFDNVVAQKRELEDIITNLERRKDLLFKENERLKAEWKAGSGQQTNGNRSSLDARLNSANPSAAKLGGLGFTSQTNGFITQSNQTKSGSRSSFQNQINLPQQQQQIIGLSGVKSAFQTNTANSNSKLNLLGLDRQNMPPAHPFHPQKLNFQTNQQNNRYANGVNTSASKSNDTSQEQCNQNIDNGGGQPEPLALSSLTNWQNQIQPQSQVPQPTAQVGSGQKMIRQSIQGLNNTSLSLLGYQAHQQNKGKQSGQQLNTGGAQTTNSEKLLNSSYQSNFGGTPSQNKNQKQSSRYSKQNQLNE